MASGSVAAVPVYADPFLAAAVLACAHVFTMGFVPTMIPSLAGAGLGVQLLEHAIHVGILALVLTSNYGTPVAPSSYAGERWHPVTHALVLVMALKLVTTMVVVQLGSNDLALRIVLAIAEVAIVYVTMSQRRGPVAPTPSQVALARPVQHTVARPQFDAQYKSYYVLSPNGSRVYIQLE